MNILCGITPSGKLTIAHYFLLKEAKQLKAKVMIADLNVLNCDNNVLKIVSQITNLEIYPVIQSHSKNISQLMIELMNFVYMGELKRMTQYKDKSKENNQASLFNYPILMTADIMSQQAEIVLVGEDQIQHIQLAQTIIKRYNKHFKTNYPVPIARVFGNKIMSLTNPDKKMSKSDNDIMGTIFISDTKKQITNKIMNALTDSEDKLYKSEHKKGITNLINIYERLTNIPFSVEIWDWDYDKQNYGDFKKELIELLCKELNK